MLVIYPDEGYDSFVSVADATTSIEEYTLQAETWNLLPEETKEVYLRIAFRQIVDNSDPITADNYNDCLPPSQALMASHDMTYGLSEAQTAQTGAIKKEQVGSLVQEFYDIKSGGSSLNTTRVPNLATQCLALFNYGVEAKVSGIAQITLGRS